MNREPKLARVLLADDHPEMLARVGKVLAEDFEIVGSVVNGIELIRAAAQLDPDVVVLDITMPGLDGIEAARRLHDSGCRAKFVFLSVHEDLDYVRAAIQVGGVGYVSKACLAYDLTTAVHEALAGRRFVSPIIAME